MSMIDFFMTMARSVVAGQAAQEAPPPWYFSPEFLGGVGGAVATAFITYLLTRNQLSQQNRILDRQLEDAKRKMANTHAELRTAKSQIAQLQPIKERYEKTKETLSDSTVVQEYLQPVLLLGPRAVGKTSLLAQWHSPWDHGALYPTRTHRFSTVPVFDFERANAVEHFADDSVKCKEEAHLKLKVHDFPGELSAQRSIITTAREETQSLRQRSGMNLGVVLICMLDAAEVVKGLREETNRYYNGELFGQLRLLVSRQSVGIERLIVVFNKFDLLKARRPDQSDPALLDECIEFFAELLKPLHGACNPDRACEAVTVLDRDNLLANMGAPIVLGEAARGFVEAIAGKQDADRLLGEQRGTKHISKIFPAP